MVYYHCLTDKHILFKNYIYQYNSPLGGITLASDGETLTGLWFDGQKHFPHKQSHFDHYPVSQSSRCRRQSDGIRRRSEQKDRAAETGKSSIKTIQASSFMNLVLFSFYQCKLHWGKLKFNLNFVRNESRLLVSVRAIIVIVAKYSVG